MHPDIDELTVNVKTYTGKTAQLKVRIKYVGDTPIIEYSFFDEDKLNMPYGNISPQNW